MGIHEQNIAASQRIEYFIDNLQDLDLNITFNFIDVGVSATCG